MKKILAFVLSVLMLLGLCACGGNNNQPAETQPKDPYAATQADVEAFAVSTIENQQRLLARAYVPVTLDVARAIEAQCL